MEEERKNNERERCNRKWPALGHSGIIRGGEERSNRTGDPRQNLHVRSCYGRLGAECGTKLNVNVHSVTTGTMRCCGYNEIHLIILPILLKYREIWMLQAS